MLNEEQFQKWTGISRQSTCAEMTAQFVVLVEAENNSIVGQSLLAADMVHSYGFSIKDAKENLPQAMDHQKVRLIADRGRILDQCDAATLDRVNVSLKRVSNERLPKLYKECLGIMDSAEVTRYVINSVRLQVIAAKVQSTPETHDAINEMMIVKGLEAPTAVSNACAVMAQQLGVAMPKRDAAAENAGDKKADTVPTMTKVSEALTAWTDDRVAGVDDDHPFAMTPEEVDTAIKLVARVVRQLLAAGESAAVEQITADIAEASADAAADAATPKEPLAKVTRRMNRAKFEDAEA